METLEEKRLSLLPDGEPTADTPGWEEVDGVLRMTDDAHMRWRYNANSVMTRIYERSKTSAAVFGDGEGTQWHFPRMQQHMDIVEFFLAQVESGNYGREKRSLLTAGRPGSGKSRFLASRDGYFALDSDIIKWEMIVRGMSDDIQGLTPFETAGYIHTESNYIGMLLFNELVRLGFNIVLEQTMSSDKYLGRRINTLKRGGYKVDATLIEVTRETSLRRCSDRHRKGLEDFLIRGEGLGGRLVPDFVCKHDSRAVFQNYRDCGYFDETEILTNDTDGEDPKPYEQPKLRSRFMLEDIEENADNAEEDGSSTGVPLTFADYFSRRGLFLGTSSGVA